MNAQERGRKGEELARRAYKKSGYKVLICNYKTRMGEIDIVLQSKDMLVFAEVKTRGENTIAAPREFVNEGKQKRLVLAARQFIVDYPELAEMYMRFDVAEVVFEDDVKYTLNFIENAFTL